MPKGQHSSPRGRKTTGRSPVPIRLTQKEIDRAALIGDSTGEGVRSLLTSLEWLRDVQNYLEVRANLEDKAAEELLRCFPFPNFQESIAAGEVAGVIEVRSSDGEVAAWIV